MPFGTCPTRGTPVNTLHAAMAARGVSPRDAAIVEGRLEGLSFADLAAGTGKTRQALQIGERRAMRALGVDGSVESIVHTDSRHEQAERMQRDARVSRELCESMDRPGSGRTKDPGERISDRLWAELERCGGRLSASRWAYYSGLVSALFAAS